MRISKVSFLSRSPHSVSRTNKSRVNGDLPITPGMQAQVDIHTGSKSVLMYLVKPVLKLKTEAFRER